MAYSLTGLSGLGKIKHEESSKTSSLFQFPVPTTDSADALLLDIFGVMRTIRIEGVFTTADGTIATFLGELDALCNGNQSTSKSYVSDKTGLTYSVLVNSVRWSVAEAEVSQVNYEIELIEGSLD